MSSHSFLLHVEIGHTARVLDEPEGDYTHEWTLFVRAANNEFDLDKVIEKVKFHLHPTFKDPTRVVKGPNFSLKEKGFGSFPLDIDLEFKNSKKHTENFQYDLILPALDQRTFSKSKPEPIRIYNASTELAQLLMHAGIRPIGETHPKEKSKKKSKESRSSKSMPPSGESGEKDGSGSHKRISPTKSSSSKKSKSGLSTSKKLENELFGQPIVLSKNNPPMVKPQPSSAKLPSSSTHNSPRDEKPAPEKGSSSSDKHSSGKHSSGREKVKKEKSHKKSKKHSKERDKDIAVSLERSSSKHSSSSTPSALPEPKDTPTHAPVNHEPELSSVVKNKTPFETDFFKQLADQSSDSDSDAPAAPPAAPAPSELDTSSRIRHQSDSSSSSSSNRTVSGSESPDPGADDTLIQEDDDSSTKPGTPVEEDLELSAQDSYTDEYLRRLEHLYQELSTIKELDTLQRVVDILNKEGQAQTQGVTLSVDLCALKRRTVSELFAAIGQ